jgi:uncharacterized protein YjdB
MSFLLVNGGNIKINSNAGNEITASILDRSVTKIPSLLLSKTSSVGDYAFFGCYYLSDVTVPNNVSSISTTAFNSCNNLKTITIDNYTNNISGSPWGATSATITWLRLPVSSITISGDTTTVKMPNETNRIYTAEVSPSDAYNKKITWSSSDTNVATIENIVSSGEGATAYFNNTGSVYFIASATDVSNVIATSNVITVLQLAVAIDNISGDTTSIYDILSDQNQKRNYIANISPSNTSNKTVTWTSSDTSVATIDNTGLANFKLVINSNDYVSTWTQVKLPASVFWSSVCWSPELNLFCTVAKSSSISATSPDGITWTQRTLPTSTYWNSICWSPELKLFCTVASNSSIAATSPDGITWTQRTLPTSTSWNSICWSPELGLFCAVAGGSTIVITSTDGITWTQRTLPTSTYWNSICWSPELGLFCAVANGSSKAATSPDGITWTQRTLPTSTSWNSICWSPELGLFCAVNGSSIAATSPDGITWTQRTLPVSAYWCSICWSPELNLFCTVTYSNIAATSPDGITWTQRTLPESQSRTSICWAPEIGKFCAVNYSSGIVALSTPLPLPITKTVTFTATTTDTSNITATTSNITVIADIAAYYLYKYGNQYAEVTSSWYQPLYCSSAWNNTVTFEASDIFVPFISGNGAYLMTNDTVNITSYSKLYIYTRNLAQVALGVFTTKYTQFGMVSDFSKKSASSTYNTDGSLDISSLTGNYYIGVFVYPDYQNQSGGYVYKVWLK